MKNKLFHNSNTGMHCVQACLQMLLFYFGRPVLSLKELDAITVHDPTKFTWMGDAGLWLQGQGFHVEIYENLDYKIFIKEGESYLKEIWDKETFDTQKAYSDLEYERKTAQKMQDNGVLLFNKKLTFDEIRLKHTEGYFVMVSVNPFLLDGKDGYGSHMVVIKKFGKSYVVLLDPDKTKSFVVSRDEFIRACIDKNDFNAIFVKVK